MARKRDFEKASGAVGAALSAFAATKFTVFFFSARHAYELTSQWGAKTGEEATRIDLRFKPYECLPGTRGALHCQGDVSAVVESFVEPRVRLTAFTADVTVRPLDVGQEITMTLRVPNTGKQAKVAVRFGDCRFQ